MATKRKKTNPGKILKPKLGKWIPVHAIKFLPGGKTMLMGADVRKSNGRIR